MKSDNRLSEFFKKQNPIIILIIIVAIVLIAAGASGTEKSSEVKLEGEVAAVCESLEGVGECRVMITYREGEVYAVAVICEGADNIETERAVKELITSIFGIGSHRVTVQKLSEK